MNIRFLGDLAELQDGIKVIAEMLDVTIDDGEYVFEVTHKEENKLTVTLDGKKGTIVYNARCAFFRAFGLAVEHIRDGEEKFEIVEPVHFDMNGPMFDVSQGNAAFNMKTMKSILRQCSLMGLSMAMLYCEDSFVAQNQPYFGYMRARYTEDEMRELDDYAYALGIELIPCIQALAHFTAFMKNPELKPMLECDDILLIGSEKTYDFLEAVFRQCAACFKSRKINIGMDEAHMVGRGKYLDLNGYKKPADVMLEHLNRVVEIAHKYGFEPMMWSDMFFRMQFGGAYYKSEGSISEEVRAKVPEGLTLIYWDYYTSDEKLLNNMFNCHKQFNNPTAFAGGAWKWYGLSTFCWYSLVNTAAELKVAMEKGVTDIISTGWGDNGSEASQFSNMAVNLYYAEHAYGNTSDEAMNLRALEVFGEEFDTLMLFDLPDRITNAENRKQNASCPSRYLYFNDPLLGLMDKHMEADKVGAYYKDAAKKLHAKKDSKFGYGLDTLGCLCDVLELKATLGIELRAAYKSGNKDELKRLANEVLPEIARRNEAFYEAFKKQWYKENKLFGFEVQDYRLGGQTKRLEAVREIINMYLAGELAQIEALECDALPHWEAGDGKYIIQNRYEAIVSPSIV